MCDLHTFHVVVRTQTLLSRSKPRPPVPAFQHSVSYLLPGDGRRRARKGLNPMGVSLSLKGPEMPSKMHMGTALGGSRQQRCGWHTFGPWATGAGTGTSELVLSCSRTEPMEIFQHQPSNGLHM